MVCPRCITTVKETFNDLNIDITAIQLGEVTTTAEIKDVQKELLTESLLSNGFELLEGNNSRLIGQIKSIIINEIHHESDASNVNFSTLLAEKLNHDYTYLSKLFSSVEGTTIERLIVKQKIERVKELLFYDQLTLSEIAYQMHYSSTAHLSAQFKKETGMTASEFKKLRRPGHRALDSI